MFDKAKCIENIKNLAKSRNIKIGDLEDEIKASKGYLSRLSNDDISNLPLDKLTQIADKLKVSLDMLVYGNVGELNQKELYIYDFVHKLRTLTETGKIEWLKENMYRNVDEPYGSDDDFQSERTLRQFWYKSDFVTDYSIRENIGYFASLPNSSAKVMLLNLHFNVILPDGMQKPTISIELYIVNDSDVNPICSSFFAVEELKTEINELNNLVFNTRSRIGLNEIAKNEIEHFMKNIDENGNVIESEEDMPF